MPVVDDLEFPWDLAFVNGSVALVTEKPGRLSRVDLATGVLTPIRGVPEVAFVGQGGLLGVELDPAFESNGLVYLAYSIALPGETYTTRLSRARLTDDALVELRVLLTAEPAVSGTNHFGGALEFDREGFVYLAVGERMQRQYAQDLGSHLGKILRLRPDGLGAGEQPLRGNAGGASRDLLVRPPQSAGARDPSGHGRALGLRARAARRR